MSAVEELYICGTSRNMEPSWVSTFFETLKQTAIDSKQVFLPSLLVLRLKYVDVRDIVLPIADTFSHRRDASLPPFRIVIKECFGANLADVESLKLLTPVEWDGLSRTPPSK